MGSTHPHRGRRPGGRHSRENPGASAAGGPRGPSPNGSTPSAARPAPPASAVGPGRAAPSPRGPAGPRDPTAANRPTPIPGYAGLVGSNGRAPAAGPAPDGIAVVAPAPWTEARPRPPFGPSAPHGHPGPQGPVTPGTPAPLDAPPYRGRQMSGEPRSVAPEAGPAPWPAHTGEANGHGHPRTHHDEASNGHQPHFAVVPPTHPAGVSNGTNGTNGSGNGAEAPNWPRTDRGQDRAERPPLRPGVRGEVGTLIEALHEIFERDRATASQGNAARCGICYLHHPRADLVYREAEGFYVCPTCAALLGAAELNMVRRQQK